MRRAGAIMLMMGILVFVRGPLFADELTAQGYKNVSNQELLELHQAGAKIVDVRTPQEWTDTGVIEGSLLLPLILGSGQPNRNFVQDFEKLAASNTPIVLICRSGNRSRIAAQLLVQAGGYSTVYNVTQGMRGWLAEARPVVAPDLGAYKKNCQLCP